MLAAARKALRQRFAGVPVASIENLKHSSGSGAGKGEVVKPSVAVMVAAIQGEVCAPAAGNASEAEVCFDQPLSPFSPAKEYNKLRPNLR